MPLLTPRKRLRLMLERPSTLHLYGVYDETVQIAKSGSNTDCTAQLTKLELILREHTRFLEAERRKADREDIQKLMDAICEALEPTLQSPVTVNVEQRRIHVQGTCYEIGSDQACRLMKILVDRPMEWIKPSRAKKLDGQLTHSEIYQLKQRLPLPVRSLIESERGKGSRFNPSLIGTKFKRTSKKTSSRHR